MPTAESQPPPRETGKTRAVRIPLDYFRRTDRWTKARAWLSGLALPLLAAGWWLSGLGWPPRVWGGRSVPSRRLATHGPLAKVHSTWDSECEACHVPFRPIDDTSWATATRASGSRCTNCHAGPPHHQTVKEEPGCASCHRDHLGREVSLVELADRACTGCHGALEPHVKAGATLSVAPSVTRFDNDRSHHPEFRAVRAGKDVGTIEFDHALHMTYGMNLEPYGKPVWTWDDLAPADRQWYQARLSPRRIGAKDRPGVQLECASCHQRDVEDAGPPSGSGDDPGARSSGESMLPIRYEVQCRACHAPSLAYDPTDPKLVMRHGLQPIPMREALRQVYAERVVAGNPALAKWETDPARPVPGRENDPRRAEARRTIDARVEAAERVLFGSKKCGECHVVEGVGKDLRIARANIPRPWFPQARFDHSAHRAVDCRGCHEAAYPDAPQPSRSQATVMLPNADRCAECHGPRRQAGGTISGGADDRCTECHRYHHGDHPSKGVGALARDPGTSFDVRRFLRGIPAGSR